MLIIALVLAVIGLAALVFAVVASNELVAWVCIGASVLGVVLLIIDALQERRRRTPRSPADEPEPGSGAGDSGPHEDLYEDYPEDTADAGGGAVSSGADEGSSRRSESGAGASQEPGGSDEYDHGNVVHDDNTR